MALHTSGPLAVVASGLLVGNHGRAFAMSDTTREHLDSFWELIDEILHAVLFLLLGLEVQVMELTGSKPDPQDDLQTLAMPEVEKKLGSSPDGLSQAEAQRRLTQYGPNEIEEKKTNPLLKFLTYFWGPIPWMIEAAVILSAVARHWPDFAIILILLLANAVVGFWEEHQAGNAIEALKAELAIKARVKRDGHWITPAARDLVPGDVIRLRLGDIVPADARLLDGDPVEVDQSALTGESLPATRKPGEAVFSGSIIRQCERFREPVANAAL